MEQGDFDLTNLNWVAGAEAPMNMSLSPPTSAIKLTPKEGKSRDPYCVDSHGNKKPLCSYTCLIAVALKAATLSDTGACLPVQEIYNCIELLFPFFKNASDGWKSSVRHVLSLSQCFRKSVRDEGWEGKKGHFWEINPDSTEAVNREVDRFLATEKLCLDDMQAELLAKWAKPTMQAPQQQIARVRRNSAVTPSKIQVRDVDEHQGLEETVIYSPQIQKQLKKSGTPVKPRTEQTNEVFDTNNTPSEFAGIHTPQSDDIGAARELFSCGSTSESSSNCPMYRTTNHGDIVPFSTSPMYGMYGLPTVGYGYGTPPSTSPIMGVSPVSPGNQPGPYMPQPIVPFMPVNMFAPYPLMPYYSPPCQKCGHQNSPVLPQPQPNTSETTCNSEESPLSKCNDKCTCKAGTKRRKTAAYTGTIAKKRPYTRRARAQTDKDSPSTSTKKPRAKMTKAAQKERTEEEALVNVESDTELGEGLSPSASIRGARKGGAQSHTSFNGLNERIKEAKGRADGGSLQSFRNHSYLECMTDKEGAAQSGVGEEGGIHALSSLLDLGNASIEGIQNAMKLT